MESLYMANSKLKILIAAGIYPPDAGGPAVHAKKQFEEFPKYGFDTGLVAFAHYRKWPMGVRHLFYFLALLSKAWRYDVVYAHDAAGTGIPALMAAKIYGKKFVVRIGGDIAWERHAEEENLSMNEWYERGHYKTDKMFKLSRFLMRHADRVVVIGSILKDLYVDVYGIDPDKIKVILNPLPEIKGRYEDKEEEKMVFASRLTAYKNLSLAIKAMAKVLERNPYFKFIIMGNGPEENDLKKLSHDLKLDKNIEFTGPVTLEKVLEETASSKFTIAPALTEFNPNYLLQGLSFGKPFIISREHGLPFAVPEELTFDPRSESDLSKKILALLEEENYRKAQDYVKSIGLKVSWDDNLRQNAEAITELLKGSK